MPPEARPVFVDSVVDDEFALRGYVLIPVLTADDLLALREVRRQRVGELPSEVYNTLFEPDVERRRAIRSELNAVIAPRVLPLLSGYKSISAVFFHKRAHTERGRVPIHQDYTFVDQSKHVGVHVWIPLVDVNEDNGCLQAFPGTHSLTNQVSTVRSGLSPYAGVIGLIESQCGVRLPMPAGMAFLYDGRLLHSSENNRTTDERLAAASVYIPQDAAVRLYVRQEQSATTVQVFEVDDFLDVEVTNSCLTIVNPAGVRRIGTEEHAVRALGPDDISHLRRHTDLRSLQVAGGASTLDGQKEHIARAE
jgi:hypothetical protein